MNAYISIKELQTITSIPIATLNRRILRFKKNDFEKYQTLTKKIGNTILYHSQEIISYVTSASKGINPTIKRRTLKRGPQMMLGESQREKIPTSIKKMATKFCKESLLLGLDENEKKLFDGIIDNSLRLKFIDLVTILNDYVTGIYTIEESCKRQGMAYDTIHNWINNYPVLKDFYTAARKKKKLAYNNIILDKAQGGLRKLLEGFDYEETTDFYKHKTLSSGETVSILDKTIKVKKRVAPSVKAIIFALQNRDSEQWCENRGNSKPSFPPTKDPLDELENMSTEELWKIVDEGRKKGLLGL